MMRPETLRALAYDALQTWIGPQQRLRQPDLLHALATDDLRRLVRALVAAEASTHLLLAPGTVAQDSSPTGTVVQQVIAGSLGALLWATTPDTHPQPLLLVEVQHVGGDAHATSTLLNGVLVALLAALRDGALVCHIRLDAPAPQHAVLTLESDRPGLHALPDEQQRLAAALHAAGGSLTCQQWATTWITTLCVPAHVAHPPTNGYPITEDI